MDKIIEHTQLIDDSLKKALNQICLKVTEELEKNVSNYPVGCCYVFGHCLAIGLEKAGFIAKEVTGHLILTDKHDNKVVYGSRKYKGKNIGYYHTWCILKLGDTEIIIDPSFKYNRVCLKENYRIKLHRNIPDCFISCESKSWLCTYVVDDALSPLSKENLNQANPFLIEHLVKNVKDISVITLGKYNKSL